MNRKIPYPEKHRWNAKDIYQQCKTAAALGVIWSLYCCTVGSVVTVMMAQADWNFKAVLL